MARRRRFRVYTVTGWLAETRSRAREGLTAYVVDEANGREIARYRSEQAPALVPDRKRWAIREAEVAAIRAARCG